MTTNSDKLANQGWVGGSLSAVPDLQIATMVEEELARLTPRARAFALALGAGKSATDAARGAQLSTHPSALCRLKGRVEPALRLLREQARRASLLTLEGAVQRFRELSEEARAAKDYSAASRALREACLLLGHYPDAKLRVEHAVNFSEVTPEEWEALALLHHGVRKALPGSVVVDAEIIAADPSAPLLLSLPPTSEGTPNAA